MNVGANIKKIRRLLEMSNYEFEVITGISKGYSKILEKEVFENPFYKEELVKMCKSLEIKVDDVFNSRIEAIPPILKNQKCFKS